jgi:hypothetical protein
MYIACPSHHLRKGREWPGRGLTNQRDACSRGMNNPTIRTCTRNIMSYIMSYLKVIALRYGAMRVSPTVRSPYLGSHTVWRKYPFKAVNKLLMASREKRGNGR